MVWAYSHIHEHVHCVSLCIDMQVYRKTLGLLFQVNTCTRVLLGCACWPRTMCLLSASFFSYFHLAVAGLRAPLNRFLKEALYKYLEWMNEYNTYNGYDHVAYVKCIGKLWFAYSTIYRRQVAPSRNWKRIDFPFLKETDTSENSGLQ